MNSTRHSLAALVFLGFSLTGCKDKPPPQEATVAPDKPAPEASASAAVLAPAPSASAVAPGPPSRPSIGPKFAVRHETIRGSVVWWLNGAAAVCTDYKCEYDATLVTEKGEVDVMNPKGIMELKYPMAFKPGSDNTVRYEGEYPDICAVFGHWEDRSSNFAVTWRRVGKGWDQGECERAPNYTAKEIAPRAPREMDDALLHAPIADAESKIIYGAGAPPLLIAEQTIYSWDGKTWSKREVSGIHLKPTENARHLSLAQRPTRLKDGSTFIPHGGYLVDAKGEITALQFASEKKPLPMDIEVDGVIWAKKHPWVVISAGESMFLTTPDDSAKALMLPAPITSRMAPAKKPAATSTPAPAKVAAAAAPSAASSAATIPEPALSASAMASALAPPPVDAPEKTLTEPKAFTAECTTPFVLLASPPKPGQEYTTTREGLRGHGELQDIVTFLELVIDGKTYFGVQTKNEADARLFMDVVEKSIKGMKPALRCLDVLSLVPDRYDPPAGIRVVGINVTTGELIPFD